MTTSANGENEDLITFEKETGKDVKSAPAQAGPASNVYLLYSVVACFLMATACVIRGIESTSPLSSKFALSLANLFFSLITFAGLRYKDGDNFNMPWKQPKRALLDGDLPADPNQKQEYVFNSKIFWTLAAGGLSEFFTSIMVLLGFSFSLKANLNQGIGSSLITLNSVFVSLFSYYIFKEKINLVQGSGILVVLIAIVLLSVCQPDQPIETPSDAAEDTSTNEVFGAILVVIVSGIIGALCFSFEGLLTKHLINKNVPGDHAGIAFLFFEGLIGTVCLIIYTLAGYGLYDLSMSSFWMLMLAGALVFCSLITLFYCISIGIAGVVVSIFNCAAALQALFSYFVLAQTIAPGQWVGIALALVGAGVLSLNDQISAMLKKMGL